jgi:hypothetical protein
VVFVPFLIENVLIYFENLKIFILSNSYKSHKMSEEFEKICAKTAEAIMETLASGEEYDSITLNNVNSSLFKQEFVPMVARYLGGKVVGEDTDIIEFKEASVWLTFETIKELDGYYSKVIVCFEMY